MVQKLNFNTETAFVSRDALSVAACIARINADENLDAVRKRDLASGLTRICEALRMSPSAVPADLLWLQKRLATISPAARKVTPKTWANIVSNAKAALAHLGIGNARKRRLDDLSPPWLARWTALTTGKHHALSRGLGRFLRFLDNNGVAPDDVSLAHVEAFRLAVEQNELWKNPTKAAKQALNAWNRAVRLVPGWPQVVLEAAKSDRVYVMPRSAFPASFLDELDALMLRMARPHPLDPDAFRRAFRPDTIDERRRQIMRFASALMLSGIDATKLTGLAPLVKLEHLDAGLRWQLARQNDVESPSLSNMCKMLKWLARHVIKLTGDDLKKCERFLDKLIQPRRRGMTPKNADRLRFLNDKEALKRLLQLPQHLWSRAKALGRTAAAARLAEVAIAIEILFYCPIRRKNLAEIHLTRNLQRLGNGKVFLHLDETQMKNGIAGYFELPGHLVEWIDFHIAHHMALLCPAGTPYLFPKRDGSGPMERSRLGNLVSDRIWKELGMKFNVHLFRHLAALLMLKARPGQYELVRRGLGHSETSTTYEYYVSFEVGDATRTLSETVAALQTDTVTSRRGAFT